MPRRSSHSTGSMPPPPNPIDAMIQRIRNLVADCHIAVIRSRSTEARETIQKLDVISNRQLKVMEAVKVKVGNITYNWPEALEVALKAVLAGDAPFSTVDYYVDQFNNAFESRIMKQAEGPEGRSILTYWTTRIPRSSSVLIERTKTMLQHLPQGAFADLYLNENNEGTSSIFDVIVHLLRSIEGLVNDASQSKLKEAERKTRKILELFEEYLEENEWAQVLKINYSVFGTTSHSLGLVSNQFQPVVRTRARF